MTTEPPAAAHTSAGSVGEPADLDPYDEEAEEQNSGTDSSGRRTTRRWWVIGGIGVTAMTAVVVWLGLWGAGEQVQWYNAGFQVRDDTVVDVRFDLTREAGREVTCRMEALDDRKLLIGSTDVVIEAGQETRSRHVAPVRTLAVATTGYVDYCWYTDQGPPPGM